MDTETRSNILARVDHTLLTQTATWDDIIGIIEDAVYYGCASVCIPPSFVGRARKHIDSQYPDSSLRVCTVIGFPNGYSTTATKCSEAKEAIHDGADELDVVINIGDAKAHEWDSIAGELSLLKFICHDKVLKVIIECCLLTNEEKIRLCEIVGSSGADYIKTSTGFGGGGATLEDIELMRKYSPDTLKIKAAGGISSFEDAEKFVAAGADRLGTSRLVKIAKTQDAETPTE
jgi:deoxyribose-phosphate aldolase